MRVRSLLLGVCMVVVPALAMFSHHVPPDVAAAVRQLASGRLPAWFGHAPPAPRSPTVPTTAVAASAAPPVPDAAAPVVPAPPVEAVPPVTPPEGGEAPLAGDWFETHLSFLQGEAGS